MDYIIYSLFFLAGGLVSYIFFGSRRGPFDRAIWTNLYMGKRVVVSIDDDAYIFEMVRNRLRITRGTSSFEENPYAGIVADDVGNISTPKPDNSGSGSVQDVQGK